MKHMEVTIRGTQGSGKSRLARLIHSKLSELPSVVSVIEDEEGRQDRLHDIAPACIVIRTEQICSDRGFYTRCAIYAVMAVVSLAVLWSN